MRCYTTLLALPLLLLVAFVAADEPMDFRELKKILPAELGGLALVNSEGQKINANGQKFTQAMGEYEQADGEADATMNIVDYSAMPQMAMAMTAWQNMEFEQESDDGYQKSTKVRDCPAMVSWENSGTGSITMLVAEKFIVVLEISQVTHDQFEAAIDGLPIDALMGGAPATTAPAE